MTNKSNKKEFNPMKTSTRKWFVAMFTNGTDGINYDEAAKYCGVSPRTVRYWWSTSCPPWIDRLAYFASRSIPDTKDWKGFSFSHDGKLLTPYKDHSFTGGQLLMVFFDKQFNRFDRVEKQKLSEQVDSLRNDEEAAAIREELDVIISTLSKLKQSPIVAPKKQFATSAKRTLKRSK